MSTSKIYRFCDSGNVGVNTTITLTEGSCNYDSSWQETYNNGSQVANYTVYKVGITLSASTAPYENMVVNYSYHFLENTSYGTSLDETFYDTVVFPAGQTSYTFYLECLRQYNYRDYNDGRMDESSETTRDTFVVESQAIQPTCGTQPSGCTLNVSGYTITAPTQRGLTNGSIFVAITGATGSDDVSYYLNGNLQTSTGATSGYTFSNLKAGVYNVYIQEGDCYDQLIGLVVPEGEFRTGDFYTEREPADLVAADNPIINNVTTKIINPSAVKNKVKFTIDGAITNNTKITFNLTSPFAYTQTFYAKHFPNKSNYFLASTLTNAQAVPVGTNSASEIAVSLAQVLQNDSVLSKVYYVENTANTVFLTARETGSRFNLSLNNQVVITGNNIGFTSLITGQDKYDGQLTDNYNIYMEVFTNANPQNQYPELGTTLDYVKIAELSMPFNQNNQHKFNLSEVVKTQVNTPMPNNGMTMAVLTEPLRSFYCKLGEIYPLVANTNTLKKRYKQDSGYFWAINSSLDREVINDMTAYMGDAGNYLGIDYFDNVPFLTNSPSLTITRNSNNYLYFLLEKNYGNTLTLRADIYLNDGSIIYNVNLLNITTTSTNAGGVCVVNVGFNKLGLGSYETSGKKIAYYDLKVIQVLGSYGSIPYTQTKRYYVNQNTYPNMLGINFQNKLGMFDSFEFIGVVEETVNREIQTYTKPLAYGNAGNVPVGFNSKTVYSNKVTKTITANTGWISSEVFNWLNELNTSKVIYSYTENYINYLVLTDLTYVKNSNDDSYNVTCTFEHTIFDNSVSI